MMKIAVISFSGNVGKSTISRHLFLPRMNHAIIIPVESINSDGTQDETVKGKQFGELQEELALLNHAIVDIGASNVEDFIALMKQYKGSHEDFDFFIVPTVPKSKQQRDTIATIDALSNIGIPSNKIRIVFNMVEYDEMPEKIFSGIFEYANIANNVTLNKSCVIHTNDIYEKIHKSAKTIKDILEDPTDFKEMIKQTTDSMERLHYAQSLAIKRLAVGVSKELDSVFENLFK